MSKNKTAFAIALFLILTVAVTLVAFPAANAHDPAWEIVPYAFISIVPNEVIGVGQDLTVVYWLDKIMPTAEGAYGDRWNFYIDITTPSGSETLGPYASDPVGGNWLTYVPTEVGTYSFVARFPGHTLTGEPVPPWDTKDTMRGADYINDTYLPATSDPVSIVVQEDPIMPWPEAPLPTEYWARPISDASREWSVLASNYFGSASFHRNGPTDDFAWGEGPESAHILWTTPIWSGGIMDAGFGAIGFQTSHYHGLSLTPPILLDGRIYYNVRSYPRFGWICRDLYTGEELYFHNTTGPVVGIHGRFDDPGSIQGESLNYGQILEFECPNQHGGFPYLWSTSGNPDGVWMMFDGFTGNYICSIANVSSGTSFMDSIGSICMLSIRNLGTSSNPDRYLQIWNTTQAIWYEDTWNSNEYWMWRPDLGQTFDGRNGFSLNVSVPDDITGSIEAIRPGEFVIGGSEGRYDDERSDQARLWCISLEPGNEGDVLWDIEFLPPKGIPKMALQDMQYSSRDVEMNIVDPEDGVVFFNQEMTREWWCYSIDQAKTGVARGSLVWGPSEPEPQMNFYGMSARVYDGKLISYGYQGQLRAYDIKTGEILWIYNASSVGFEAPYGNYPLSIGIICDGKIYTYTSEHSDTHPLYRGPNLRCINATNGAEIWKILDFDDGGMAIADGRLVKLDSLDNQIYCFGKGPTSTKVSIQDNVVMHGDSVLVTGVVTDVSPGTEQHELAMRFPNGVPAISDGDMTAWMEYLYKNQEMPTATGVEVVLETLDPNGNFYEVGRATSDASGNYGCAFTPEVPGLYTIIATFEGSKSYYGSYAETFVNVEEAPQATPTPTPPPQEPMGLYLVGSTGAIIVAIAVGFAILLLKKR